MKTLTSNLIAVLPVFLVLLSSLVSCNKTKGTSTDYIAIRNRDTASLSLTRYGKRFFGKLIVYKPGAVIDSGEVRGDIINDSLIGDFHYLPFGAKHTKRRAFALRDSSGYLVRGYGIERVYMGIPYYVEGSITFRQDGFIFDKVSSSSSN